MNKLAEYLQQHPACVSALGMGPVIAASTSLVYALTISLVFTGVLCLSAVTVSGFRKFIPHTYRLAFILPVTSMWVTVADLLLQAYAYEIRMGLDIYIPLIAMNSLVLMLLEKEALRVRPVPAAGMAGYAAAALVIITVLTGTLRELLGQGSLLPESVGLSGDIQILPAMSLFNTAAGGFIVLGCVIAIINYCGLKLTRSVDNA
ncbi:MAG: Rnf-Nqr domain containing protein [Gammaproteobacteria bacterium]